jgi:hypothetical protein
MHTEHQIKRVSLLSKTLTSIINTAKIIIIIVAVPESSTLTPTVTSNSTSITMSMIHISSMVIHPGNREIVTISSPPVVAHLAQAPVRKLKKSKRRRGKR